MSQAVSLGPGAGRDTPFSYACKACGRCCRFKGIQVNPYEIARLSAALHLSSARFLSEYTVRGGTLLRSHEDGTCVFWNAGRCSVHRDRPLVCRLYPLGRVASADGSEHFYAMEAAPGSEGVFGTSGTIDGFLDEQGAKPYMHAADVYYALLIELMARAGESEDGHALAAFPAGEMLSGWYDIDRVIEPMLAGATAPASLSADEKMALHVGAIRVWLATTQDSKEVNGA